jgi:hypothetical protein
LISKYQTNNCSFFISSHLILNTSTSIGLSKADTILFRAGIRFPEVGSMEVVTKLIIFVVIIISVNNFVLFYALRNNGAHLKNHSPGMAIFLISLVEIVAIGIYAFIHFRG